MYLATRIVIMRMGVEELKEGKCEGEGEGKGEGEGEGEMKVSRTNCRVEGNKTGRRKESKPVPFLIQYTVYNLPPPASVRKVQRFVLGP